jgi:hypothetical protein
VSLLVPVEALDPKAQQADMVKQKGSVKHGDPAMAKTGCRAANTIVDATAPDRAKAKDARVSTKKTATPMLVKAALKLYSPAVTSPSGAFNKTIALATPAALPSKPYAASVGE